MSYSVVELLGKGPYYIQLENKANRNFIKNMGGELPRKGDFISLRTAPYVETIFKVKGIEHSDIGIPHVFVKRIRDRQY